MIHRRNTTSFRSSHTNFFCNILSTWKLQILSFSLPKRMVQIHLKDWLYLLHRISTSRNITILMYRRCGGCLHFCHCKAGHSHLELFSEHWPSREGKKGPLLLGRENSSHLVPVACFRNRRHGSGHTGAPRGAQDPLLRDASGGPRSREPPGRAQGRAAARLGPRGPSRAGLARTHIPQRRTRQPPAALAGTDGRLRSRGRGRGADAARARPERGPAQPVSAAGGRRWPLLPPFCSASASCSPRRTFMS